MEGAIISLVDTILVARNPVEERPRRRHERDPRETAGPALGGASTAPDIVAGAFRHRRPWSGGLRLGGRPGGRPPDLVASLALGSDRLRRFSLSGLLRFRRESLSYKPGTIGA